MYGRIEKTLLGVIFAGVMLAAPPAAQAVTIVETFNSTLGEGQYQVTNDSTESIYAFAIGNDAATSADGGRFNQDSDFPDVWNSSLISRDAWESGSSAFGFGGDNTWTVPDTSSLDWDSIFSADLTQIIAYWVVDDLSQFGITGTSTPVLPGQSRSHFTFSSALPASPFIAFGQFGNTVDQGEAQVVSSVPVPPALWLFITGMLGLTGLTRAKRAR